MKQRGSAILIAVFLVAAVGSAAFAIGRLFLLDASISDKYESSVIAYYAAESGIEEGLLRYRYNKNQEVPIDTSMTIVNLSDFTATTNNPNTYTFQPLKRYYVPSVEYLTEFYGENVDRSLGLSEGDIAHSNYPEIYRIPKDEAIKLDLSKVEASDQITLFVKYIKPDNTGDAFNFTTSSCSNNCPFLEVALTGNTPLSSNLYQSKMALVKHGNTNSFNADDFVSGSIDVATNVITYDDLLGSVRAKNKAPIFDTPEALSLMLKPLYADAIIGIKTNSTGKKLPAPYNTVKSTGYYGGVTRTLEAKIDRQAGTVYDLFDFVLYESE